MIKRLKNLFTSNNEKKDSEIVRLEFFDELSAIHIPKIKDYGISDLKILECHKKLNGRERDIIWSLYNEILNHIGSKDPKLLKDVLTDMVSFLEQEEKNSNHLVEQINKLTLKEYKNAKIKKVEILSMRDGLCKLAEDLDGQVYSLNDAHKYCPIPADGCEKKHCTCTFIAIA